MVIRTKLWVACLLMLLLISAAVSCSSGSEPVTGEPDEPEEPAEEEPDDEEEPEEETGPFNPFTGLPVEDGEMLRRPIAVIVDNHPGARPQRGLMEADLIFEVLVEGGITRLVPIYLQNEPEVVGPVRSVRKYQVDLALAMDAVLAHCGGSPGGLQRIEELGAEVFNDLRGAPGFFRDPIAGVSYEHTLFTDVGRLRSLVAERGFERDQAPLSLWDFCRHGDCPGRESVEAARVSITYPGGLGYVVSFEYDPEEDLYRRFVSGREHTDRDTGEQLSGTNIVVLRVATHLIPGDTEGRLEMDLTGEGEGLLITGGRAHEIVWTRTDSRSSFELSDLQGERLVLRPGLTWIEMVTINTQVSLEEVE